MALRAVLFDMDGVIVDSEPLHKEAFHRVFADLGITVAPATYYSFSGSSTRNIADRLVEMYSLQVTSAFIVERKRQYFESLFYSDHALTLIPGVEALIQHYFAAGIKLVIASSASRKTISMVCQKFGLEEYFLGAVSGDDLAASKPHPEIFLQAAALASEPVSNCLVIEDAANGILAAHRAGIFCAAYRSAHTHLQDYTLANLVVSDFQDLRLDILAGYFS